MAFKVEISRSMRLAGVARMKLIVRFGPGMESLGLKAAFADQHGNEVLPKFGNDALAFSGQPDCTP